MPVMDEVGQRDRLAKAIEARRLALGLSASAAARTASIDRATWSSAEKGERDTLPHNWAGIERALRWKPGSIATTLNGGEPSPVEDDDVDEEIELVRSDPKLTDDMRERIIALIRERRENDKVTGMQETRRLLDLFRRG